MCKSVGHSKPLSSGVEPGRLMSGTDSTADVKPKYSLVTSKVRFSTHPPQILAGYSIKGTLTDAGVILLFVSGITDTVVSSGRVLATRVRRTVVIGIGALIDV